MTVSQGPERPDRSAATLPARLSARLGALRISEWRWRHEHLLLAAAALGVAGVLLLLAGRDVAADAGADVTSVEIALPASPLATVAAPEPAHAAPSAEWRTIRIAPGQTMGEVFARLGLSSQLLHRILEHPGAKARLSRIRPGDEFAFAITTAGELSAIRFDREENERVVLHLDSDGIREQVEGRAMQRRVMVASGEIRDSLFNAGERAGMTHTAILELAKAFGYDIDFAQDLRVGDRFDVVYEEIWRDGERLRSGDVLAATFVNQGKTFQVFRYQFADGRTDYFDAEGRPMKKGFLRMPIDFARISSRFSTARKHPVLGTTRAHKGVDYAAATGTPIMAAGDGRIAFAGWKNGYGRTVIIQHADKVTTLYGHMSRLGAYKNGSRVRQGDVIGYVGATGLATGPHLHYEFRIGGVHRDPLKVTMPKPEPLPQSELARFRMQTQPLLAQLDLLAGGRSYAAAR